jgi:hypothetical protein
MGFGIPSLSNMASSIGNAVGAAASKAAEVVTQQAPATAPAPAASTAPAAPKLGDVFESAPSKPAVCGGTSTSGAQCLPDWGKAAGGGGGAAGINPSSK